MRLGQGVGGLASHAMALSYREHVPPPALREHLVCLWTQTLPAGGAPHASRILPDACVDIVCVGDGPPLVAGPATMPVIAVLPAGAVVVGARLRPGSAAAWLGSAADLRDREVPLEALWGEAARVLQGRLARAGSVAARLAVLVEVLTARLGRVRETDARVGAAVRYLGQDPWVRVEAVARTVGLGERQLLRRFEDSVGYGPKTLQRILRLQRVLLLAGRPGAPAASLADLAQVAGFADQAHLARESRALTGLPAQALLQAPAGTLGMSDLFNADLAEAP
jgi:AraC-like DNA-binding protein